MDRVETVRRASQQWARDLTDISGRNRLLYYRSLKVGTLDLATAEQGALARLLSGKPGSKVQLSTLFRGGPDEGEGSIPDAVRRARAISRKAMENFEERGVSTLFLAQGLATWTAQGTRAEPAAPVLLCNVGLHRRGASETDFDLSLDGEWTVNDALMRYLAKEFAVSVSGEELLGTKLSDARLDDDEVAELFADLLAATRSHVPGFRIARHRLVLGNFMYRKMPMVSDIEDNLEALATHDLIAAVAGDGGAREVLRRDHSHDIDWSLPDVTPPADEFLVLDADSSQNIAVNEALAGASFVLQGPPGTGKSQTIANTIATTMARGRRVLFVAEKRAAIDAVTKRLKDVGLDGYVMDFHGGTLRRRELARRLAESLNAIGQTPPVDEQELHERLEESRRELSGYAEALHRRREPWETSFFDVQSSLLALEDRESGQDRGSSGLVAFSTDVLKRLDGQVARGVRRDLRDWADLSEPIVSKRSPWTGAHVVTVDDVRRALELLPTLRSAVSRARQRCRDLLGELGLPDPGSLRAWGELLDLLVGADDLVSRIAPEIFDRDLNQLATGLAPARGGLASAPARLFSSRYRAARREIAGLLRHSNKIRGSEALELVETARDYARRWLDLGGTGHMRATSALSAAVAAHGEARGLVEELLAILPDHNLRDQTHDELTELAASLAADEQTLNHLPRLVELNRRIAELGVDPLIEQVQAGVTAASELVESFDRSWLGSIRRELLLEDRSLADFAGHRQNRFVSEYCRDDAKHLQSSPARIRRWVAEHAIARRNEFPEQCELIRKEAAKKTRHLPLRRLFEQAPDVLTSIRPCWAMSPLDVAQTLPPRQLFDLVIFDEASQVLPCDAIPALLRAPRAMVAGDSRQLLPTTFFDGGSDDEDDPEEDAESLADYESILDVMDAMVSQRNLVWHYRSADERLIAFSNRNIYRGSLTTFPGADSAECLDFVMVDHRPGEVTDTRSNSGEVRRVVDLMIDHARHRPGESLGVIAMGRHHADRIEASLRKRLGDETSPELERFFDESLPERAFVKNLERVQGDERDAIILSVGYGKTSDGRLVYRFGPLNNEGGERRLNVAITRARRRMTVVSSFSHVEMDPARTSSEGVRLLRDYLRYAESGGVDLSGTEPEEALNPFEFDVLDKLTAAGLSVIPQYGCSGYRIDFAVCHPEDRGRFVLAVEADGASYHSSRTARDRDRLRQEHLERLGWRFCRIWSTDWFNDHAREVDRVLTAYDAAVREADASGPGPAVAPSGGGVGNSPGPERSIEPGPSDADGSSPGGGAGVDQSNPQPVFASRGPAPRVPRGLAIDEHDHSRLVDLARWVISDGRLRTDEEIFEEMFQRMGYGRRGHRIRERLNRAIAQAKNADSASSSGGRDTAGVRAADERAEASGRIGDPQLPSGRPIQEHHPNRLVQLVDWIMSDGHRRSDEELLDEMSAYLGYNRRSDKVTSALSAAIRRSRYLRERYGTL